MVNLKKFVLFFTALFPSLLMLYQLLNKQLGADPVDAMLTITGIWAIRFLLITLAITPIRQWLGINLMAYRRMLGLYVFFYALLHFGIYFLFEQNLDIAAVINDMLKRNFILLGMIAFILLIPLAITSTNTMMKRLGSRWRQLHKAIYWVSGLALCHFIWIQKSDYTEPLIYLVLFFGTICLRKIKLYYK